MYGKLKVSLVSEKFNTDYVARTLEVFEPPLHAQQVEKSQEHKVYQFLVQVWPKDGQPESTSTILDLIENVNKRQMGQGKSPITVMCE